MMNVGNFILHHCKEALENKQKAIVYAVLFSIFPFATWISVALVCLVALRKGAKAGVDVLLPALVIHFIPLMMLMPLSSALVNTLIIYLPCFFAALILRSTEKWQVTFGVFFLQALLGCLFIQILIPNFVRHQFQNFKLVLAQYPELVDSNILNSVIWPQLFLGIQILSVIVSATISLMFARSIQAKLFLPDGFRNELKAFRSGKLSFLVFTGILLASYYEIPWAINLFPLVLCYFLLSGFGLVYYIFSRKNQTKIFIILILLVFLRPGFVLSTYIIFGLLDSLVNLRLYFPVRASKSI